MPPSASPSDGGCAEGSFGLTALEGWGRGAFPQPWVGGMQPLRPSARQLPDPKLPPLPHRRAAGVAEGIAPEDPGDGSPTRADLDTTRVPGDTGPCHPSGAPSPDHGRLCQDWDTVGYEDHGTGDGSGVGGMAAGWGGWHPSPLGSWLWGAALAGCNPPPKHPKPPPLSIPRPLSIPIPQESKGLGKAGHAAAGRDTLQCTFCTEDIPVPTSAPRPRSHLKKQERSSVRFFSFFLFPGHN